MRYKIQPITIQQSRCIFVSIACNLPIMRRAYVPLIGLVTVLPMARYKIVMQRSLVLYLTIIILRARVG